MSKFLGQKMTKRGGDRLKFHKLSRTMLNMLIIFSIAAGRISGRKNEDYLTLKPRSIR